MDLVEVFVESGCSPNRTPFVELSLKSASVTMSPEHARNVAILLFRAAEAAESDAFVVGFAMDTVGLSEREAAKLLFEFRNWREAQS